MHLLRLHIAHTHNPIHCDAQHNGQRMREKKHPSERENLHSKREYCLIDCNMNVSVQVKFNKFVISSTGFGGETFTVRSSASFIQIDSRIYFCFFFPLRFCFFHHDFAFFSTTIFCQFKSVTVFLHESTQNGSLTSFFL